MSISDRAGGESDPTAGQLLIKELRAHLRARGRLLREHERRIEHLERTLSAIALAGQPTP